MLSLSDALEFAKFYIFGIGIHHTSLLGIWFAWSLSVLALIFVIAMRDYSTALTKRGRGYYPLEMWKKGGKA